MCLRDHLFLLPDPCCSPFLRLQLLRKDRSFLHVIWVTNNGRAWEGAGWETLPIRPIAIHLTDSRDGWAAGEWQQEHHHHRYRPWGAGRWVEEPPPQILQTRWLRTIEMCCLTVLKARRLKSGHQNLITSESCEQEYMFHVSVLASDGLLAGFPSGMASYHLMDIEWEFYKPLPRWLSVKNLPANARDSGSVPESGISPGVENGNLLQYFCLENSTDRGAWQTPVHGVTKSRTRRSTCPHT